MANEKRLIDAKALWEYVKTTPISAATRVTIMCLLDNAPTVDAVEVVHAKWEDVQNGKGCCSNCHRLDSIDNIATHCRYCGAKLDGGNKDV